MPRGKPARIRISPAAWGAIGVLGAALLTAVVGPMVTDRSKSTPGPTVTPSSTTVAASSNLASTAPITVTNDTIPTSKMVQIPAGEFTMGGPEGVADLDAQPERTVYLKAYWIDENETANREYQQFVIKSRYRAPKHWIDNQYPAMKDDHPVVNVTWHDADAYCRFLDKRLPTEAEWEKAARGEDGLKWPWGHDWNASNLNSADGGINDTQPVGTYKRGNSLYGIADMAGNVWEWVNDWYDAEYYKSSPSRDPLGPPGGPDQTKVMRGGAWPDAQNLTYTFTRLGVFPPDYASEVIGFRCACDNCQ